MRVFGHVDFLEHVTPPEHPECVDRARAVTGALAELPVERHDCPLGEEADILRCHPEAYISAAEGGHAAERLAAIGR